MIAYAKKKVLHCMQKCVLERSGCFYEFLSLGLCAGKRTDIWMKDRKGRWGAYSAKLCKPELFVRSLTHCLPWNVPCSGHSKIAPICRPCWETQVESCGTACFGSAVSLVFTKKKWWQERGWSLLPSQNIIAGLRRKDQMQIWVYRPGFLQRIFRFECSFSQSKPLTKYGFESVKTLIVFITSTFMFDCNRLARRTTSGHSR